MGSESPHRQEPVAPSNNATSRNCELATARLIRPRASERFPPPAGAGGCQGAGLRKRP